MVRSAQTSQHNTNPNHHCNPMAEREMARRANLHHIVAAQDKPNILSLVAPQRTPKRLLIRSSNRMDAPEFCVDVKSLNSLSEPSESSTNSVTSRIDDFIPENVTVIPHHDIQSEWLVAGFLSLEVRY
jgi:hypothetical protein